MLKREKIIELLEQLNVGLAKRNEIGEVGIVGGAAMCVVYNARASTKDVDAIFKPTKIIREIVSQIGAEQNLESDWLNDAAKGYIEGQFDRVEVLNRPNLRVWSPEPRYMLAMKCLSSRWDSLDRQDVEFLVNLLQIKSPKEVFKIIESYFPKNRIPPKTQFFIEELMQRPRKARK